MTDLLMLGAVVIVAVLTRWRPAGAPETRGRPDTRPAPMDAPDVKHGRAIGNPYGSNR